LAVICTCSLALQLALRPFDGHPAREPGGLKPEIVARVPKTRPGCYRTEVVNDPVAPT
jgi:hypothetical protein